MTGNLILLLFYIKEFGIGIYCVQHFCFEHPPLEKNTDYFDTYSTYITQSGLDLYSAVIQQRHELGTVGFRNAQKMSF